VHSGPGTGSAYLPPVSRVSHPDPIAEASQTIAEIHARAHDDVDRHHRWIERAITQVGRPRTVYVILGVVASWILFNTLGPYRVDPAPFFWLQGCVALYSALVATSVLVRQNREAKHDLDRDQLELHVNLLAEQRTAKIIALLEELREDLPNVRDREDREAKAMTRPIDPRDVLATLDEERRSDAT
jgi:uncharacterized membrane protein